MKIPAPNGRPGPALLTGLFVGLGMSAFVALSELDAAFPNAPAIVGTLAGIGTFLLVFSLH
jgi:hypothetical protein